MLVPEMGARLCWRCIHGFCVPLLHVAECKKKISIPCSQDYERDIYYATKK